MAHAFIRWCGLARNKTEYRFLKALFHVKRCVLLVAAPDLTHHGNRFGRRIIIE